MTVSIQQKYNKWNNVLYNRYTKKFDKKTTIWDGVIFPEKYAEAPLKVMILNKEAYDPYPENIPYDLCKAIRDNIKNGNRIFPDQNTLRTHLKQYLKVLDLGTNGFLSLSDDSVSEQVQSTDYDEFLRLFERVAYCNVKKSDGNPKSNKNDLYNHAKDGLDILKEQIRFFNPSVILAGNVCEGILEGLVEWGEDLYIDPDRHVCIWQIMINDDCFPFVDMYHPSLAKGMGEYFLELLHSIQEVEKKHPGFWQERMNKSCFVTQ